MELKPFSIYKSFGSYNFVFKTKSLSYTKEGLDISRFTPDKEIQKSSFIDSFKTIDDMLVNMDQYLRKDVYYQTAVIITTDDVGDRSLISIVPESQYQDAAFINVYGAHSDPYRFVRHSEIQKWVFNLINRNTEEDRPEEIREVRIYPSIELAALTDELINYQSVLRTL